jgi:hypothetical protein
MCSIHDHLCGLGDQRYCMKFIFAMETPSVLTASRTTNYTKLNYYGKANYILIFYRYYRTFIQSQLKLYKLQSFGS